MSKPKLTLCAEELDAVHTVLKARLHEAGAGTLDLARVERVRAALEEARTRPEWRTFKVRGA